MKIAARYQNGAVVVIEASSSDDPLTVVREHQQDGRIPEGAISSIRPLIPSFHNHFPAVGHA
jgi:hypothetical protein